MNEYVTVINDKHVVYAVVVISKTLTPRKVGKILDRVKARQNTWDWDYRDFFTELDKEDCKYYIADDCFGI